MQRMSFHPYQRRKEKSWFGSGIRPIQIPLACPRRMFRESGAWRLHREV